MIRSIHTICIIASLHATLHASSLQGTKPNIVLIMPDDISYGAIQAYGGGIGQNYSQSADFPNNDYNNPVLYHNGKVVETKGYCTDLFFDQAIRWIGDQKDKAPELYHIAEDIREQHNLAEKHPEIVERLKAQYDAWWEDIQPYLVNDQLIDKPETHKPFHDLYREQLGQERFDAAMRAMTWTNGRPSPNKKSK